jgi:hypothetical protein
VPDARRTEAELQEGSRGDKSRHATGEARNSEFPVSQGGMNQESSHNKHNDPGQPGHKPQQHSKAEERR